MNDKIKQIIVITALLIGLLVASVFYFKPFQQNTTALLPYQAIPSSTPFVIDAHDLSLLLDKMDSTSYSDFYTKSAIFSTLKTDALFLNNLDSILNIQNTIFSNDILIGAGHVGGKEIGFLYITAIDDLDFSMTNLNQAVEPFGAKIVEYSFQGEQCFTLKDYIPSMEFTFTQLNGLLVGSFHSPLVEDAINTAKNEEEVLPAQQLIELKAKNTLADFNIIINQKEINNLSTTLLKTDFVSIMESQSNTDWSYLSMKIAENSILWNGETFYTDENLIKLINTDNKVSQVAENLPLNTAYFQSFLSTDSSYFVKEATNITYWTNWIDNEYAYFVLETFDTDFQQKSGMVFLTKDEKNAKASIENAGVSLTRKDTYGEQEIFAINSDFNSLFPHYIVNWDNEIFITFAEKTVFIANDISTIKTCLQKKKEGNTLASQSHYQEQANMGLNGQSSMTYCNIQRWKKAIDEMFLANIFDFSALSHYQQQSNNTNGSINSIGELNFGRPIVASGQMLWSATLDTISQFVPQVVKNHNDGSQELMTQDASGNLYLLSASGEIVFKQMIEDPIISEIFQVDYYKNGKLQYVFNTVEKIYIIDRNGTTVGDFPLNIPAKASSGILVTNYDNARDYRIFVATQNSKIYGFELDGAPLANWSPNTVEGTFDKALSHTLIDEKDYIFGQNINGDFIAFARNGDIRIEAKTGAYFNANFKPLKDGFVNGTKGKVYKITLEGEIQTAQIINGDYDSYNYTYSQQNDVQASAFCNGNKLIYAKTASNQFMTYSFDEKISTIIPLEHPNTYFAAHTGTQIYMIDEYGKAHNDFPKESITEPLLIKLYEDKDAVMVVQDNEGKLSVLEIVW
ncbi:MAG: hypothetical protein ACPG4Z_04690 [Chitinophagales bacterium]